MALKEPPLQQKLANLLMPQTWALWFTSIFRQVRNLKDDGAYALESLSDSAATNNSLYYSTTQSAFAYKDSNGTVFTFSASGSIALDDLSDVAITSPTSGQVVRYNGTLFVNSAIDAGDVTSGTFADARISASSVTQHEASIDHNSLLNYVANQHINWTSTTENLSTSGTAGLGATTVTGDLTVDTNTLYVDSTNDFVGIGTATPLQDLHIEGDAPSIMLHDTGGGVNRKRISLTKDDDSFYIRTTRDANLSYSAQITMDVDLNTTFPNNVTVNGDLNLSSDLTIGTNKLERNINNFLQWTSSGNVATWQGEDTFEIRDPSTVFVKISTAGDVGIGATTPAAKLDVRGSAIFNEDGDDVDFRVEGDTLTHAIYLDGSAATENIALLSSGAPNWQSMDGGLFIANATTVPTGNPTGGGFLYVEGGALKYRGSSGTVTTLGAA